MSASRIPSMKRRIFIVDPMCAFDYGHNPKSLVYFSAYLQSRGFHPRPIVCKHFVGSEPIYSTFEPFFDYYYQRFVPIKVEIEAEREARAREDSARLLANVPAHLLPTDGFESLALANWLQLIRDQNITADDHVFYPSVDYYGVCGLLRALMIKTTAAPRIHLRFIGVMEYGTEATHAPLRVIRALLAQADPAKKITISAESSVYAKVLQTLFGRRVETVLYPLPADVIPLPREKPYIVYSAGSGRLDKGFFRMRQIAAGYLKTYPRDDVLFKIQNLRSGEERTHEEYLSQLYACPNVELLSAVQTDAEMERHYRSASFLVMPYDFEVYRLRGSAVFMEGISKGRPFALTAFTGFHLLAESLETAFNVTTDSGFCEVIAEHYRADAEVVYEKALRTAERYQTVALQALDTLFATAMPAERAA